MNASPIVVPQANPGAGYRALKAEIDAAVARALGSGWYILGEEGRAFEAEFAAWLGAARAVGCGNGTDALALALRGLGHRAGHGGRHRLAYRGGDGGGDRDGRRGAGAASTSTRRTTRWTRRSWPTVLAHPPAGPAADPRGDPGASLRPGRPTSTPIMAACARHGVAVIEDCSQAHGATLGGRKRRHA